MIHERLIERIEGEATLLLEKGRGGEIHFAEIIFPHFRGMEKILERKPALDALALTPRVCGICGHAHLMATVAALESCYENAGIPLEISPKARAIRSMTLALEIVQNHFKWFYLTLLPAVPGYEYRRDSAVLTAHRAASTCAKAIASLAGQWPHTSYALPGGVMCDPTHLELLQVDALLHDMEKIFRTTLLDLEPEEAAELSGVGALYELSGDLPELLRHVRKMGWESLGRSYDRFIVLSRHPLGHAGKSVRTRYSRIDTAHIEEGEFSDVGARRNYARPVRYRGSFFETGPLARAMVAKTPIVRDMHRRYKDGFVTRVTARIQEVGRLLAEIRKRVKSIDLGEPSWIEPRKPLSDIDAVYGRGTVEAARGSLMHTVHLRRGKILRYCIVTPTQWNLANGTQEEPGVAQNALVGLPDEALAEMVFKSFDVCSVCTTQ